MKGRKPTTTDIILAEDQSPSLVIEKPDRYAHLRGRRRYRKVKADEPRPKTRRRTTERNRLVERAELLALRLKVAQLEAAEAYPGGMKQLYLDLFKDPKTLPRTMEEISRNVPKTKEMESGAHKANVSIVMKIKGDDNNGGERSQN